MPVLNPAARFQPRDDLLTATVNGEIMLLDIEAGRYFAMDRTGTRVFDLLKEQPSVEAVIAVLCREYDVEEAICRRDVEAYVQTLLDRHLVVVV
jgi:hypothetical protein